MDKWQCTVCDYVYEPEVGDPSQRIPANTPFEELPQDWVCPWCGVDKSMFERQP